MKEFITVLEAIIPLVAPVVIAILAPIVKKWLDANTEKLASSTESQTIKNAIYSVEQIVIDCVKATNQTYVEALKKEGAFTEEKQKEALAQTTTAIMAIITDGTKEIISKSVSDFSEWLNIQIEKTVNDWKGDAND